MTATPSRHPVSRFGNAPQASRVFGAVTLRQRQACRCDVYRLGTLKGATLQRASFPPPPRVALLIAPTGHAAAPDTQAGLHRRDDMEQASIALAALDGVI